MVAHQAAGARISVGPRQCRGEHSERALTGRGVTVNRFKAVAATFGDSGIPNNAVAITPVGGLTLLGLAGV